MYPSELDEVILAFESEQAYLEALIKEALEESDYLLAATHQKGLRLVKHMLERLRYFKDPNLEEKQRLEKMISGFERPDRTRGYLEAYFEEKIPAFKARLDNLKEQPTWVTPDENELTEALYDLIEGKNAGFRLHLRKNTGFFIEFRLGHPAEMLITLSKNADRSGEYYWSFDLKGMRRLGFDLGEAETGKMSYRRPLSGNGDVSAIKLLLAEVLYGHSFYIEYDRPSTIEFL